MPSRQRAPEVGRAAAANRCCHRLKIRIFNFARTDVTEGGHSLLREQGRKLGKESETNLNKVRNAKSRRLRPKTKKGQHDPAHSSHSLGDKVTYTYEAKLRSNSSTIFKLVVANLGVIESRAQKS